MGVERGLGKTLGLVKRSTRGKKFNTAVSLGDDNIDSILHELQRSGTRDRASDGQKFDDKIVRWPRRPQRDLDGRRRCSGRRGQSHDDRERRPEERSGRPHRRRSKFADVATSHIAFTSTQTTTIKGRRAKLTYNSAINMR